MSRRLSRGIAGALAALVAAACAPGLPRLDGAPGAAPAPSSRWPVPVEARTPPPRSDSTPIGPGGRLSVADVVDLALRNNPTTSASWAAARGESDVYGAARGALLPTVDGHATLTTTGGTDETTRTQLTPSLTASYLVFDFGGRSGDIEAAKQRAIAANLAHNATIADVALQAESALFDYLAARALADAQTASVDEARTDLAAAEERYRVGVATLQDVLQTRTQLSQEQLQLATLESNASRARGQLATEMGFGANAPFEVSVAETDSVSDVTASVDTLMAQAVAARPELAQSRALAEALAAEVRTARSAMLPALSLNSTASDPRTLTGGGGGGAAGVGGPTYSLSFGLSLPLFNGFSRQYELSAAQEAYRAGLAREASTRLQVGLEVWTDYYALVAATQRVRTAADLLRDATQSATVATGRYQEGVGTIVDVLLARSALVTARAEAVQARWEWRTSLAQLAHDAGALDSTGRPDLGTGQGILR